MAISKTPIIILLIIVTFVAFVNADKLSKLLRTHCIVHDATIIQNVHCVARSVNRSVSFVNIRGNITKVLNKVSINIQLSKRSEVKFIPFLVNVTEDYCLFFAKHSGSNYMRMLTSIYLPYTNLNHTCPYFGYVYIKDLPLDANNAPSLWPIGEYRLDVTAIGAKGRIITLQFFIEIKEQMHIQRLLLHRKV